MELEEEPLVPKEARGKEGDAKEGAAVPPKVRRYEETLWLEKLMVAAWWDRQEGSSYSG